MNDEGARQGAPDQNRSIPPSRLATDSDDVRIPSVSLVVELEHTPRIVVDAASEADRQALRAWVRECRPDLDKFLRSIAVEIHEKKAA